MFTKATEAKNYITEKLQGRTPKIGLVLGSGLGDFADQVTNRIEIDYNEIPHFHKTSVVGHKGRLVCGQINGVEIIVMQGRFHAYEGHSQEIVVLPVRTLGLLGVEKLVLTNAAGGINPHFSPGDLVCITDHINMTGNNPLIGANENSMGDRFPDMSEAYRPKLNQLLSEVASKLEIKLKSGVYAAVSGPSYETPAEVKMLGILGADLVGMSTYAETIAAHHMGLKVCAISCVTNLAAGLSHEKLAHEDVKIVANQAMEKFTNLLNELVASLEKERA